MEGNQIFKANLHRGGLGLAEMRRLLEAFARHGDIETLRHEALDENLLGKTSEYHVKALLSAFKRRFLELGGLPSAGSLAAAMTSQLHDAAKTQIIFPYYVLSDSLVERCYRDLVLGKMETNGTLSRDKVSKYLKALSEDHAELRGWSDYLQVRWSSAFLSLLRLFGFMTPAPNIKLRRFWLLPEPFCFFWLWLWEQDCSFWDVERNHLWKIFQLDETKKDELLVEGRIHKWWVYERSGTIVTFKPTFSSLKEWLDHGLE